MTRTLKTLMVLAAFAAFASVANAATVTPNTDDTTYLPGETITITVTVSTTGGEAAASTITGAWTYNTTFLDINGVSQPVGAGSVSTTNTQTAITMANGAPADWTTSSSALTCSTTRCLAFAQVKSTGAAVPPVLSGFLLATTKFIIAGSTPIGTVLTFNWQTSPTTQRLSFFGVTGGPGLTVTVVPEPTTAAMLGLGLLGLALAGRRRA